MVRAACLAGVAVLVLATVSAAAVYGPERSLAGVKIGGPAWQGLKIYGTPTRVETTSFTPGFDQSQMAPAASAMALPSPTQYNLPPSPLGAVPDAPPPVAGGAPTNLGGALGTAFGGDQMGLFGGNMGGFGAVPAAPVPGGAMTGTQPTVAPRAVTKYYYDYASGPSLVFTIGRKGLVEQIDAFAPWPWKAALTKRRINVGSTYKQVVAVYGYPESQRTNSDGTLVMDYSEKAHVAFTLMGSKLKVVGVSVALVE